MTQLAQLLITRVRKPSLERDGRSSHVRPESSWMWIAARPAREKCPVRGVNWHVVLPGFDGIAGVGGG